MSKKLSLHKQFLHTFGDSIEANLAGAKWVGKGARLSSSGTAWISADGTRQYRPPTVKKKSGRYQANFESRSGNTGPWENNEHLDIQ